MTTQPCPHPDATRVESGGRLVAGLCPACDRQLPAAWFGCSHDDAIEVTEMGQALPEYLCPVCGATFGRDDPADTRHDPIL